jgi:hypothetical protein
MKSGGRRVVPGVTPFVVGGSVFGPVVVSLAEGRVSDFGAGFGAVPSLREALRFSDLGAEVEGAEARTILPHLGQVTSLKSWSGGMRKE